MNLKIDDDLDDTDTEKQARQLQADVMHAMAGTLPSVCLEVLVNTIGIALSICETDAKFEAVLADVLRAIEDSAREYRGNVHGWDLKH